MSWNFPQKCNKSSRASEHALLVYTDWLQCIHWIRLLKLTGESGLQRYLTVGCRRTDIESFCLAIHLVYRRKDPALGACAFKFAANCACWGDCGCVDRARDGDDVWLYYGKLVDSTPGGKVESSPLQLAWLTWESKEQMCLQPNVE